MTGNAWHAQYAEGKPLEKGTVLNKKYRIEEVLGQGSFGITYLATDMLGTVEVAVKEYFPYGKAFRDRFSQNVFWADKDDQENNISRYEWTRNEAFIMEKVKSLKGIVMLRDYVEDYNTEYLVTEYFKGITLKEWVQKHKRLEPQDCFAMLEPVMRCLSAINNKGIIHRDICHENILVSGPGNLKIIDFGSAIRIGEGIQRTLEPTYRKGFSPLEQYEKENLFGSWTDVYAFCATVYYCLTKSIPQDAQERAKVDGFSLVIQNRFKEEKRLSALLERGMALDGKERIDNMDVFIAELHQQGFLR